jgi:hypothetical protein
MTVLSAALSAVLRPAILLATLVIAPLSQAWAAEAIGAEQIIDLVTAAKHITYGNPQKVTLAIAGRSVAFTVSVGTLGAITAVPEAADKAVKQISVAVTTTNDGVVPNAVTVITGDGQVLGFTVRRGPDGAVIGLVTGVVESAPVGVPPHGAQPPGPVAHPLGVWVQGAGLIGAALARPGALIGEGVSAAALARAPARLVLLTAPNSVVTLQAGAEVSIATEKDAAGTHLIITLSRGAVEVSLGNQGGYRDVLVRGAAMQVRATAALVVVERGRRDADYVALVTGHAKAGLRKVVAATLGKSGDEVDLAPHQGLGASVGSGLGEVEALSSRPSVTDAAHTIQEQATSAKGGFGNERPEILGTAASAPAGASSGANAGAADK